MLKAAGGRSHRLRWGVSIGIVAVAALGIWARLSGLGASALANDEYYWTLSILQILDHGVPSFETGGAYTRGILLQYLTVPGMLLTVRDELGIRLPSVIFGLATVCVGWFYGRRTLGVRYAVVLTVMLLLSSWEVEFSRFGRMYAGFQFATLCMLTTLHDATGGTPGATEGRSLNPFLAPASFVLMLFMHQLSLVLFPLLLLPLFLNKSTVRLGGRRSLLGYGVSCLLVAILVLGIRMTNFRSPSGQNSYPVGFSPHGGGPFLVPYFPFWHLAGDPFANLMVVLCIFGTVAGFGWWLVRSRDFDPSAVVAALLVTAATAHLLLVALVLGLVLVLRFRLPWTFRRHTLAAGLALLGSGISLGWVTYAAWLTYGAGSREWILAGGYTLFREAGVSAFVWPNPWDTVIAPWWNELPVLAVLIALALVVQILLKSRRPIPELIRNPAFVILYLVFVLGVFRVDFQVTRYTYFAYPVALALLVLGVKDLAEIGARRVGRISSGAYVGIPVALLLFAVSGDFNLKHLALVGSPAALYRTGEFQRHEVTWYPRDDFAAPADFINEHVDSDPVIVEEAPSVSYYLEGAHAVYLDRSGHRFSNVSRHEGTVDFWSGQRLLSTRREVADYTRCSSRVWVIRLVADRDWIRAGEVWPDRLLETEQVFVSPDGAVEVVRVDLKTAAICPDRKAA